MKNLYQISHLAAVISLATAGLVGCQQENSPPTATVASAVVQQVNTIEPSATSAQQIGIYRPIFIDNVARAERGIARLASQQAATQMASAPAASTSAVTASTASISASTEPTPASDTSSSDDTDISLLLQEDMKQKPTSSTGPSPSSAPAALSPMASIDSSDAGQRYDTAMSDLYTDSPLTTATYDTLVDIAVFTPDVFSDPEINQRLQYHSPALARMVNQHQVWKKLEIARQKQSVQLQKEQEAKFNKQLEAFNKTLEEYDKKIADYQVRLSESDKKNPEHRAKAEEAARYEKKK